MENGAGIEEIKQLRASMNDFGLSKICPVMISGETDDDGLVLGSVEKRESVEGTLANRIRTHEQKSNVPAPLERFYGSGTGIDADNPEVVVATGYSFKNTPVAAACVLITIPYFGGLDYCLQFLIRIQGAESIHFRTRQEREWRSWKLIG